MKSRWITHKGKQIFFVDFANFGTDNAGLRAEGQAVTATILKEPPGSVLVLSDVRGTVGSPDNLSAMQSIASQNSAHVARRATIGLEGSRRAFLNVINRFTGNQSLVAFDDEEQAKDWLVAGD
jgi:hypothetical protein